MDIFIIWLSLWITEEIHLNHSHFMTHPTSILQPDIIMNAGDGRCVSITGFVKRSDLLGSLEEQVTCKTPLDQGDCAALVKQNGSGFAGLFEVITYHWEESCHSKILTFNHVHSSGKCTMEGRMVSLIAIWCLAISRRRPIAF